MTPSQALNKLPAVETEPDTSFVPIECLAGTHYTSEAMEEDFSTAVDLLMNTPRFLEFLRDADKHFDILGEKAREQLKSHIDTIEDFLGQWMND